MQDAPQQRRLQALCLTLILALGFFSLPLHVAEQVVAATSSDAGLPLLPVEAPSEAGHENSPPESPRPDLLAPTANPRLFEIRSYSGVLPCDCFPVLPQAPPVA